MKPTIGRIVLYTLTEDDAKQINRRRTTATAIAERIKNNSAKLGDFSLAEPVPPHWPLGAQAHIGNDVTAGEVYPMVVTRVWSETTVNGQVLLDGNDCLWASSATEGEGGHTWSWPLIPSKIADSMPDPK